MIAPWMKEDITRSTIPKRRNFVFTKNRSEAGPLDFVDADVALGW